MYDLKLKSMTAFSISRLCNSWTSCCTCRQKTTFSWDSNTGDDILLMQTRNIFCKDRSERMYQELPPSKNQPILSLGTGRCGTSWIGWTSSFPVLFHVGAVGQVSQEPHQQLQPQFQMIDTPNHWPNSDKSVWDVNHVIIFAWIMWAAWVVWAGF